MKDEKIREFGTGCPYQPRAYFIVPAEGPFSHIGRIDEFLWGVADTSLQVYPTSQSAEGTAVHSGEDDCFYRKTATQSDWQGQEFCRFPGSFHQQSSPGGPGRILSGEGSWQKRRRSLTNHSSMTACGSRNSHRFTTYPCRIRLQQRPHPHAGKP